MKNENGLVYLVGAGPGDPGLITLRGAQLLSEADLVLYDGLTNPLLLHLTSGICERTARTRIGDGRIMPQIDVNQRLVEEARAGRTVVRLKGGDPCIFGRGGEEARALEEAGINYEIVPGITAATAAGAYAGFSFTDREASSAVAFVTGHEDPAKVQSQLDYEALANFPGTLVFYMGLGNIERICAQLIEAGSSADTPAAVVTQASLPRQRVVTATLKDLPAVVAAHTLTPPSLIVVGECIDLKTAVSWFDQRPLAGQRIGITRPADQCLDAAALISQMRGEPAIMPLIQILPVEHDSVNPVLNELTTFDWLVFTSVNGVNEFFRHLWESGRDCRALGHLKTAAIGSSTASALKEHGLNADIVPEKFRAEELATALAPHAGGQRVLWARANRGRDVLPTMLKEAGADVTECVVYRNEDVTEFDTVTAAGLTDGSLSWVGLSSPSIAAQFARLLNHHGIAPDQLTTRLVCISPVTAEAAREQGLPVSAEATTYTWHGIVEAIVAAESANEPSGS